MVFLNFLNIAHHVLIPNFGVCVQVFVEGAAMVAPEKVELKLACNYIIRISHTTYNFISFTHYSIRQKIWIVTFVYPDGVVGVFFALV